MAMNHQWQPSPLGRTTYSEYSSNWSPLALPNKFQNAIPTGTVRSQVAYLQSLANPDSPTSKLQPEASSHTRESSRTGFGRRLNNRFGMPALQNTQPEEQPRYSTSHSFLGLSTPRTNHSDEHAVASSPGRYGRSPGINGRLVPVGLNERSQQDALSPLGIVREGSPARGPWLRSSNRDTDNLNELLNAARPSLHRTLNNLLPASPTGEVEARISPELRGRAQKANTDETTTTTSTLRRQNVRDLFADHGLDIPEGLTSTREPSQEEESESEFNTHRYCHECSWVNNGDTRKCWRCGHLLCRDCAALAPIPLRTSKNNEDIAHEIREARSTSISPMTKVPLKETTSSKPNATTSGPNSLVESKVVKSRGLNQPSGPRKASSVIPSRPEGPRRIPSKKPVDPKSMATPTQAVTQVSSSQVTTSTKNSTLTLLDKSPPHKASKSLTANKTVDTNPTHGKGNDQKVAPPSNKSSISTNGANCDSPGCCATHRGHEPFRHAASCTRLRPKRHILVGSDTGYVADRSFTEEQVPSPPAPFVELGNSTSPSHKNQRSDGLTPQPLSYIVKVQEPDIQLLLPEQLEIPEYVECHGYPRTGHVHHSSPVSSGIVGECQHCLDDCQCAACQSTHHNVRCCMHKDHQTRMHLHFTPRKENAAIQVIQPVTILKTSSPSADAPSESPPLSGFGTGVSTDVDSQAFPYGKSGIKLSIGSSFQRPSLPPLKTSKDVDQPRRSSIDDESNSENSPTGNLDLNSAGPRPSFVSKFRLEQSRPSNSQTISAPAAARKSIVGVDAVQTGAKNLSIESLQQQQEYERRKSCTAALPGTKSNYESKHPAIFNVGPGAQAHKKYSISGRRPSRRLSTLLQQEAGYPSPSPHNVIVSPEPNAGYFHSKGDNVTKVAALILQSDTRDFADERGEASVDGRLRGKRILSKRPFNPVRRQLSSEYRSDGANLSEHFLSDDEFVREESETAAEARKSRGVSIVLEDHECVWRARCLSLQKEKDERLASGLGEGLEGLGIAIKGMTLIMRIEGREDLVAEIEIGSWKGGELLKKR